MVLLLQTFNKQCSKFHFHNHSRHGCKASSSVSRLQAFHHEVSSCLNQLLLSSSDAKTLSFQWLLHLLQALPILHQAFAKLVVDLNCPVEKWSADLVDEYLNYTHNLLDLLNSISFSLSQLGQSRLLLAYALNLVRSSPLMAISRLKPIVLKTNFTGLENRGIVGDRKKGYSGEEWAIGKALATMVGIGYWVCGIVISGCEGDSSAYLEMGKSAAAGVMVPAFKELDSVVSKKGSVPQEVKEVNCAVAEIVGGGGGDGEAAEETRRRLGRLEKAAERLAKEVDERFSEVLDGRSQLLDVFRQTLN